MVVVRDQEALLALKLSAFPVNVVGLSETQSLVQDAKSIGISLLLFNLHPTCLSLPNNHFGPVTSCGA